MFPYLDNSLSTNWLQLGTVTTTTTPTAVDLVNAVGPVMLSVKVAASGSGTLSLQPVMSTDNITFISVPANAILDPTTGLPTTFSNVVGSTGGTQQVALKRDELYRYVSLTETNVGAAGSVTLASLVQYARAYTSQAI